MSTALAFVPAESHRYRDHPESPDRLRKIAPRIESLGDVLLKPRPASREELARVHRGSFIDSIEQACEAGDALIDLAPTYVTQSSFDDACLAAGAAVGCVRTVMNGEADNAFAIVRPPGHHAEPDRAMGFCLFNNVAIAAQDALQQGVDRIAIVDFDAHHGNGTQAAFAAEERVAYLSTHQWGIYPGSGWIDEVRSAPGRIVNVPLPAGSGDAAYASIALSIITPFLQRNKPQLILVSAGYDAHWNDPITSLGLSTRGFYELSRRLVDLARALCGGKIVFVLEGGYDPANLANGIAASVAALRGMPFSDPGDAAPHSEPDVSKRLAEVRDWNGF